MPLINVENQKFPPWSEVDFIEIIRFETGESRKINKKSKKEIFFIGSGKIQFYFNNVMVILEYGEHVDFPDESITIEIKNLTNQATLVRIGGCWGEEVGDSGVFRLERSSTPNNIGDAVNYQRNTYFDNHYHDCDEYWIILQGSGEAVTEGERFYVRAGDCIVTRKGAHHDFPIVKETIHGVYFETTLKGKKRKGHLWDNV